MRPLKVFLGHMRDLVKNIMSSFSSFTKSCGFHTAEKGSWRM